MSNSTEKFRILAFCGGGMRGLLTSQMLKNLNERVMAEHSIGILDKVDMYAGTSTGSLISGLLAMGGDLALEFLPIFYFEVMAKVMKEGNNTDPSKPELSNDQSIRQWLDSHPKIATFLQDKPIEEFKKHLLFTSFHVGKSKEYQPGTTGIVNESWGMVLFNNFDGSSTSTVRILDAMTSSGAMPGIEGSIGVSFTNPVTNESEKFECVDGAFVNHDPTIAAVSLALNAGYRLENISVITLGTGFMRNYMVGDTENWGSEQWLNLPESASQSVVPPLLVNTTQKMPVFNMMLNGTSTNEMPTFSSMMLQDRYAYLNADFGNVYIPENVTDPTKLEFLISQANGVNLDRAAEVFKNSWL